MLAGKLRRAKYRRIKAGEAWFLDRLFTNPYAALLRTVLWKSASKRAHSPDTNRDSRDFGTGSKQLRSCGSGMVKARTIVRGSRWRTAGCGDPANESSCSLTSDEFLMQSGILAAFSEKVFVPALFYDLTILEDDDAMGIANGGEAMSHDKTGSSGE
jgi:hypothetical protein